MKNGTLVKLKDAALEFVEYLNDVRFSENLFRVVDSRRGSLKVAPVRRDAAPEDLVALAELTELAGGRIYCDVDHSRTVEVFIDEVIPV